MDKEREDGEDERGEEGGENMGDLLGSFSDDHISTRPQEEEKEEERQSERERRFKSYGATSYGSTDRDTESSTAQKRKHTLNVNIMYCILYCICI